MRHARGKALAGAPPMGIGLPPLDRVIASALASVFNLSGSLAIASGYLAWSLIHSKPGISGSHHDTISTSRPVGITSDRREISPTNQRLNLRNAKGRPPEAARYAGALTRGVGRA